MRRFKLMLAAAALATAASPGAAKLPATWDGLVEVKAKKLAAVYLLPNADFRAYSKDHARPDAGRLSEELGTGLQPFDNDA